MSCKKYRNWVADAAAETLGAPHSKEFDEHIRSCAACKEFFAREKALAGAIDCALVSTIAESQPSPEFLQRARFEMQKAITEPNRVRLVWLTATACVAAFALAAGIWAWRTAQSSFEMQRPESVASLTAQPNRVARNKPPATRAESPRLAGVLPAKHAASKMPLRGRMPEPQVIVPPGQMEAVMQFVKDLDSRKIDGAKLLASMKVESEPLPEIKPLKIEPLVTPEIEDRATSEMESTELKHR